MALVYHVYASTPAPPPGNPVNDTTPVATVPEPAIPPSGPVHWSWTGPAIPPGSIVRYLIRAYDTVTGLESQDINSFITIQTDSAGHDFATYPPAPTSLHLTSTLGGGIAAEWTVSNVPRSRWPTSFAVFAGIGSPNMTTPVATISAQPYDGLTASRYYLPVTGLTAGQTYSVIVCGVNAAGTGLPSPVMTVTPKATGPQAIDTLVTTTTSQKAR